MTPTEKRIAVLQSAAKEIEARSLGGVQARLTLQLAAVINKFLDRKNVKLEMTCLILDTLTEEMCVAVYDDAEADGRVERIEKKVIIQ